METQIAGKRHILLVEDDPTILRQVEFNLTHGGYAVETANNGVDALKKMIKNMPDLLVTDVMMPEMDGYELAETVRADPQMAHIPIIMLTARTQETDMMMGHQSGTDIYLTKPYDPTELLAFVRRILR